MKPDQSIIDRIAVLVEEEHRLRESHEGVGMNPATQARLDYLKTELDSCWALVRQQRAGRWSRARAGADTRSLGTAGRYPQTRPTAAVRPFVSAGEEKRTGRAPGAPAARTRPEDGRSS